MIIFYFSGTGNSKYVAEAFCREMSINRDCCSAAESNTTTTACYSIEEDIDFESLINSEETIGFCYPIYCSRVPRIMREFVTRHIEVLKSKKLIIFCTQVLFSGDGAKALTYVFPREYRRSLSIIYAEHFFMPNNVSDLILFPIESGKKLQKYVVKTERKMQSVCKNIKYGKIKRRGFNIFSQFLGLFQGILAPAMERNAHKLYKINSDCSLCKVCVSVCPMKNLVCENNKIAHKNNCTICYRCVNKCPQKAITFIFNGKVKKQYNWSEE